MPRVGKLALIAFGLLIAGVALFFLTFDANALRGTIQSQLEANIKRKVSIGFVRLGLFPVELQVQNLEIGQAPPLVKADELGVQVALWPLLSKRVEVQSLRIRRPKVELVETAPGKWNYETPGEAKSSAAIEMGELQIEDGQVAVTGLNEARQVYEHINLKLSDFGPGKTFHLDAAMQLPQALELDVAAKGRQTATGFDFDAMEAKLGGLDLTAAGRWDEQATDLRLKLAQGSITEAAKVAAAFGKAFAPDMKVTGALAADVRLSGPSARLAYEGTLSVEKLEALAAAWPAPVKIPAMSVKLTPDEIVAAPFTIESNGTRVTAAANVKGYSASSGSYRVEVRAPNAELTELLRMAVAYGGADLGGLAGTGQVSLDVRVDGKLADGKEAGVTYSGAGSLKRATVGMDALPKPLGISDATLKFSGDRVSVDRFAVSMGSSNATGSLSVRGFAHPAVEFETAIDELNVDDFTAAKPKPGAKPAKHEPLALNASGRFTIARLRLDGLDLKNVQAAMTAKDGVVKVEPLTADLAGGRHVGALTIDTRPAETAIAWKSSLQKVEANQVLRATTSLKDMIFGRMAADGDLRFTAGNDIGRTLNGSFSLNLNEGRLAGVNLVNEVAGVAKLLGFRKQGEAVTNLLGLSGSFRFNDGVGETKDLRIAFDGGTLSAAGLLNLADQSLRMKLTAKMTKAFSDQFAGGSVGGLLTTALSNENGELVIPMNVNGSLSKPVFTPDAAEMAKLRVRTVAPKAVSAAKGVLDAITGKKDGPPANETPQTPADAGKAAGKALLDIFKRKKE